MSIEDLDEPETTLLVMPPGFPYDDLRAVADILQSADVFLPGYIPPPVGLYEPDAFIFETMEGSQTILLPDRNIVSRLVKIAKGDRVDSQCALAAAVLTYAQHLNFLIEPSISFHELHGAQGTQVVREELRWFRSADNSDPKEWLAFALGKGEPPNCRGDWPTEEVDLSTPLRRWRRNYIAVLKIAELTLKPGKHIDRMMALIQWMKSEFIFAGPAIMFAAVYFAPNSPPKKGLIEGLNSLNRYNAIKGAKNAAWDITHLSIFLEKVNAAPEQVRYIFATFDKRLANIGKLLFSLDPDASESHAWITALSQWWPKADAERIVAEILASLRLIKDPARMLSQRQGRPGYIDFLIQQGEAELLRRTL